MSVAEAKMRFKQAADDFTFFEFVKERPVASMSAAFLAGFGMSTLGASRATPPLMATVAQIIGLVAQFAPIIAARARSSDG